MAITVFNNICYRTDGKQMAHSSVVQEERYLELLHYLEVDSTNQHKQGYKTSTYKCIDYNNNNGKTRYYTTDKVAPDAGTSLNIQCVNYELGATAGPIAIDIPMNMYTMHQYKQYFYIYAYDVGNAVQGPAASSEHNMYLSYEKYKNNFDSSFYLALGNLSSGYLPTTYCNCYKSGNEELTSLSCEPFYTVIGSYQEIYYTRADILYTQSKVEMGAKILEFKFELEPLYNFMLHDTELSETENISTAFELSIGFNLTNYITVNIHSEKYIYNTDCTIKYPMGDSILNGDTYYNFSNYHIKNGDTSTCKISIKNNEYPDASLTKESGTIKFTGTGVCYTKYPRLVTQSRYKSDDGKNTYVEPWYNNNPGQTFAIGQDCSFFNNVDRHAIYDTTALDFSSDTNQRKADKKTNIPQIGDIGYNSSITYTITRKYDKDNKEISITGSRSLKDATLGPGETIICDLNINAIDTNVLYRTFVKPMISYQLQNDNTKSSIDYMNNFFCIDGKIPDTGCQLLPLLNSMSTDMRALSFLQDVHPTDNDFKPGKNPLLYNVHNGTFVGHLSSGYPNSNGVKTEGDPPYYDVCLDYSQLVLDASEGINTIDGTKNLSMDHMPTKYDDVIKKNEEIKNAEKASSTTTPTTPTTPTPESSTGSDSGGTDPTQTLTPKSSTTGDNTTGSDSGGTDPTQTLTPESSTTGDSTTGKTGGSSSDTSSETLTPRDEDEDYI